MGKLPLVFYNIYSLLFCLRHLPFKQAIKIPILIHPSVKVRIDKSSSIVFPSRIWRSMLSYGFRAAEGRSNCHSMLVLRNGSQLFIKGAVIMSKGTRTIVEGGKMEIGHHFFCNGDCSFYCNTNISIGNDNMYGWGVHFSTTDGHSFFVNGKQRPMNASIIIGNHVWIGANSIISKGTEVASECVVAQCSLVNGRHSQEHCLIGGIPAIEIKENINWAR